MGAKTPEIKVTTKVQPSDELKEFKTDIRNIGFNENQMHPTDFLKKHEDLLMSDIDIFCEILANTRQLKLYGNNLNKLAKICEEYLKKSNADLNALRLADAISILRDEINQEEKELIIDNTGKGTFKRLIPPELFRFCFKLENEFAKTLKKPVDRESLDYTDNQFLEIADKLDSKSELARKTALKILMESNEKSFENIAIFKKIIRKAINSYPFHNNYEFIELVLERGEYFMENDTETKEKINEWLAEIEVETDEIQEMFDAHIKEIKKLMEKEDYREALIKITNALQVNQQNIEMLQLTDTCVNNILREGEYLQMEEKYDEALNNFNFVLKLFPKYPNAISAAIFCNFLKSRQKTEDLKSLEGPPDPNRPKEAKISEENMQNATSQAMDLFATGKLEEAKLILNELNKINPDNPAIIHSLAICSISLAQKGENEAINQLIGLENLKTKKEKIEKVISILPTLTKCLQHTQEYLSYQKYLIDNNIGGELVDKSQMFTVLTEALKISKARIQPYITEIKKWIKETDISLPEDQRKKYEEFFRAEADLLALYYPEKRYSIWDLYTVEFDENKKHIIEDKEGIPVKIDTIKRIEIGYENVNPVRRIILLKALSKDAVFKGSATELLGTLYEYKKTKKLSQNFDKIFLSFKKNLTRLMLKGKNNEKFEKIGKDLMPLIENKEIFLSFVSEKGNKKKKNKLPKKKWGEESIDPTIELTLNFQTLDAYLNTIRLEPENIEHYEAFFKFIKKIKLMPQLSDELAIKQRLKEIEKQLEKNPKKASQEIFNEILSAINLKKSLYIKEKEEADRKKPVETPDDIMFTFSSPSFGKQTGEQSATSSTNSNLLNSHGGAMLTITMDPTAVLDFISRKLKGS